MKDKWSLPIPQPTTPFKGDVTALTFDLYRAARSRAAQVPAAVQTLFDTFGAYKVKPKRDSAGIIWNNQAFWWSKKGHYRNGSGNRRQVLHQLIWAQANKRAMPPKCVVIFLDGDGHNFQPANLALRTRTEMGSANCCKAHVTLAKHRQQMSIRRWEKQGRKQTASLLDRFNAGGSAPLLVSARQKFKQEILDETNERRRKS